MVKGFSGVGDVEGIKVGVNVGSSVGVPAARVSRMAVGLGMRLGETVVAETRVGATVAKVTVGVLVGGALHAFITNREKMTTNKNVLERNIKGLSGSGVYFDALSSCELCNDDEAKIVHAIGPTGNQREDRLARRIQGTQIRWHDDAPRLNDVAKFAAACKDKNFLTHLQLVQIPKDFTIHIIVS